MWWIPLTVAAVQAVTGASSARQQSKADMAQWRHNLEVARMNYELQVQDREMALASRTMTRMYQESASNAERFRAQREATMARVSQGFREQDRSAEKEAVRLDAVERRGTAQAIAGASGVSGISVEAVQRAYEVTAGRIVSQIQAEEVRDDQVTRLNVEDIFLRSANEMIRINQPLDGVGGIAPLLTPAKPTSATRWANTLSAGVGALQTFGSMGGEFPGSSR